MKLLLPLTTTLFGAVAYTEAPKGALYLSKIRKEYAMDRYAIFVDAGYFFAAGAQATFGAQTPRKNISITSPQTMLDALCERASGLVDDIPLLRTYWYDAIPGPRLSLDQSAIAMLTGIKMRLGVLNSVGEQKGVDSLIVTDLIDLARNRAIADAVIVTGDEDLRIAVQIAQSFGVRVHILAAGDPSKNVNPSLQMEADSITNLDGEWFSNHIKLIEMTSTEPALAQGDNTVSIDATLGDTAQIVINGIIDGLQEEQCEHLIQHFSSQTSVPSEYDRPLIARVSSALSNRQFTGDEKRHIRGQFIRSVRSHKTDGV
jgi:hypothetical protein